MELYFSRIWAKGSARTMSWYQGTRVLYTRITLDHWFSEITKKRSKEVQESKSYCTEQLKKLSESTLNNTSLKVYLITIAQKQREHLAKEFMCLCFFRGIILNPGFLFFSYCLNIEIDPEPNPTSTSHQTSQPKKTSLCSCPQRYP